MDEKKLQELFRDAVPDAPPPSFSLGDVRAESGAQRTRHRNLLMGGSALGIAILAGAAVLGVALWRGTDSESGALPASAPGVEGSIGNGGNRSSDLSHEDQSPRADSGGGGQQKSFPPEPPKQGGTPTGNAGPPGPGSTLQGCGQADRELAAALAGELPAAANSEPRASTTGCPPGSAAVAVHITDGGRYGLMHVVLAPVGPDVNYPITGSPEGTVVGAGTTPGGRRVYVIIEPLVGSPGAPFAEDVQRVADGVAKKY